MKPRLSDVSGRAGVSQATVSRVLNGKSGVAPGTRRRVLDVMAELGYQDLPVRDSNTGVVGLITPEMDNPIFPHLVSNISPRLTDHGFLPMVCSSTTETVNEMEYLDHFSKEEASAVVVINGRYCQDEVGYEDYERLRARGLNVILVNGMDDHPPIPSVAVDIRSGGAMATRHLMSLGHRRIGCVIGPMKYHSARHLYEGYVSALGEPHRDDALVVETMYTAEGGRAAGAELIEAGATAVVCGNDLMAIGVAMAATAQGLDVPTDLSVVGFDGTPSIAYFDPVLTTVHQPVDRMARAVATLVENPQYGTDHHVFRPDLMIGESTAPVSSPRSEATLPG